MKKEHSFNEAELIGSMQEALAHAKGKLTLKTAKIPKPTKPISALQIAKIRHSLNASRPVFAAYLNVTEDTVKSWEKDRRSPSGPALRLLSIAAKRPEVLLVG